MENFIFSVNVALPILLLILTGFGLRKAGMLNENAVSVLNKFSFNVALPLFMFRDIAIMDFYTEFRLSFVLFCFFVSVVSFLVIWFLAVRFMPNKREAGSFAQGSVRGSVAILAAAIVTNVYGSAGIAAVMVAATVPVYNVMSVLILTFCSAEGKIDAVQIKKALVGIVTNPLIIGIVAGLPFALLRIRIPAPIFTAVSSLGSSATPLALIVIGASFNFSEAITRLRPAVVATAIKLIILPAAFIPVAIAMGFRDAALMSILLMLGSATAPASYIMSRSIGCDAPLSANIVLLANLIFPVILTGWLFLLKSMALI